MKNKLFTGAIILLMAFPALLQAQGKKKIKELGIHSITVHEYFLEDSKDKYIVESIETFDKEGRLIELKEFNSRSEVRKWEKYGYDAEDRLIEETFLDAKGGVITREKTVYEGDLKTEKLFYDSKDRLIKRKKYIYNFTK